MMANLESRIKTSAERELVARNMIRKELVEKAENNDIEGIKEMLTMIAEEAEKTNQRPRASVEVRNDAGQSLLSIAAQHNYAELASFLLTYWKTVNENRIDFISHEKEDDISPEAKIFKANPNSRDLKGWTCVCIAVFHNATKVLPLLLEHGGDPNIKSSYNKNAWDLAKDELDAAEKVVKSNAEIRQILIDYDQTNKSSIFGNGEVVKTSSNLYDGLDENGTPIVMNIEMNQEAELKAGKGGKGGGKSGGGGGKGKSGGGGKAASGGGGKGGGGKKSK